MLDTRIEAVNAVHISVPSPKICFNTNPLDTADAIEIDSSGYIFERVEA
ncbi:MAG: hypothetical protein ACI936_001529 [Paraglaciecola sp.]|jgi:hypothetical protein